MPVNTLSLHQFRNFGQASIAFDDACTIVLGENGTGKSSIIEALGVISTGRSFRTHNLNKLIQHQEKHFVVTAEVTDRGGVPIALGYRRTSAGKSSLRYENQAVKRLSDVTKMIPLQVVTHEGFGFFDGGPDKRRRFMDYGLFHVKPDFINSWRAYKITLKQRNEYIRQCKYYDAVLSAWDAQLSAQAEVINTQRLQFWQRFMACFDDLKVRFDLDPAIALRFYPGWQTDADLKQLLCDNFSRDKKMGYTLSGAHRFDIKIKVGSLDARDVLSRGQQKILFYALIMCQVFLLHEALGQRVTVAIDDLSAEIDTHVRRQIVNVIRSAVDKAQFIITTLDRSIVDEFEQENIFDTPVKMFHVKHDEIKEA